MSACGFSPMYSSKNSQLYNIKIINLEGDNKINSIIRLRLKNHKNINAELHNLSINTIFEKRDLTKNIAGNTVNYQINATTIFNVTKGEFNKIITINRNFSTQIFEDKFEERSYEIRLKEDIAKYMYEKFILEISKTL
jgi:hypothetical protein